jgi:hypothetical protein
MGTFAGTAIGDYNLSFANQGNKLLFSVAVFNIHTAGAVSIATISEKRPGLKLTYLLSGT